MHEKKFKAWSKSLKQMIGPFSLWEIWEDGCDMEHEASSLFVNKPHALVDKDDWIFFQYLGVKDMSGKECYECDVIAWPNKKLQKADLHLNCQDGCPFTIVGNLYLDPGILPGASLD